MRVVSLIRKFKWLSCAQIVLLYASSLSAQTAKPTAEVPFEFVHNQIVVRANIGGKGPFHLLLDTNTDPSAIDSADAKELRPDVASEGPVATGPRRTQTVECPARRPSAQHAT